MEQGILFCCRRLAATGAAVVIGCSSAPAQTFSEVYSRFEPLGSLSQILAVADFNGDGRNDILAGEHLYHNDPAPEERLATAPLRLFVAVENDGNFKHAPELVDGTIDVRAAVVVADDFNGDTQPDLAVFDAGVYVLDVGEYYGNPPQLFLSSQDGRLRPSEALADAVRHEHELRPSPRYSGPADLHVKTATSGDIDGDADIDLWVESSGGANVNSHFMVNNGDGTFTLDPDRAPYELLHNPPPEFWRHVGSSLVDLDNDGDLDLALGQIRDLDPTHINQSSIVLLNDGTGHYLERIELPHPAFADGYTSVQNPPAYFDVNADGFQDLLIVHDRNDDGPPDVIPWTGRYIQVLINDSGTSFSDETTTWMGDQSATAAEFDENGDPLYNVAAPRMHDVDGDGCLDLVMSGGFEFRAESMEAPIIYRNNGSGQFQAMSPEPFATHYSDWYSAVPTDLNGDTRIDFVTFWYGAGADDRYETPDDVPEVMALLNATPAGPIRCSPRVKAVGTLPDRTLYVGTAAVVVSVADAFQNVLTYQASSSAPSVATVSVSGSDVTITAVAEGSTTITVTASGADNSIATQQFKATATAFTSAPARRSRSGL